MKERSRAYFSRPVSSLPLTCPPQMRRRDGGGALESMQTRLLLTSPKRTFTVGQACALVIKAEREAEPARSSAPMQKKIQRGINLLLPLWRLVSKAALPRS